MSSQFTITDAVRSRFSTIISEDNTTGDAILLVLQMIRADQETHYREISQKLDHFLSIQSKPAVTNKAKKTKKSVSTKMDYFIETYAQNEQDYKKQLGDSVDQIISEYEDLLNEHEGETLALKTAELIWSKVASTDEAFIQYLDEQIKSANAEDEEKEPTEKKTTKKTSAKKESKTKEATKKASASKADSASIDSKTKKPKKTTEGSKKTAEKPVAKAPVDSDNSDAEETKSKKSSKKKPVSIKETSDSEEIEAKPKKSSKKNTTKAPEDSDVEEDDITEVASNLTEDIEDVEEEVITKKAKKPKKTTVTTKKITKKAALHEE